MKYAKIELWAKRDRQCGIVVGNRTATSEVSSTISNY